MKVDDGYNNFSSLATRWKPVVGLDVAERVWTARLQHVLRLVSEAGPVGAAAAAAVASALTTTAKTTAELWLEFRRV